MHLYRKYYVNAYAHGHEHGIYVDDANDDELK